ncbi:hypothetical protein FQR65_LT12443 [Abscondita terminalis]|nr:hypothetical protein FQR65_LT12443 [Abscondita terminalis]
MRNTSFVGTSVAQTSSKDEFTSLDLHPIGYYGIRASKISKITVGSSTVFTVDMYAYAGGGPPHYAAPPTYLQPPPPPPHHHQIPPMPIPQETSPTVAHYSKRRR